MRFAVLGAGAVGAYVGAALARSGADVTLIARGAHLAAMQQNGVRVLSPRGDFAAHPPATDDLSVVADADVVFVALKAYSLPGIAPRLGELLAPGSAAIWAQNGIPWWYFQSLPGPALPGPLAGLESVDPGGIIAKSIAPEHNVGCVVYCSTEIIEPGVIRHIEGTRFTLGEPDGASTPRCAQISDALMGGGLRAPVEPRLGDQIWLKLIGNVAFNPVTALTRATLGELGTAPEMVELLKAVFAECAAVAERLGIAFAARSDHPCVRHPARRAEPALLTPPGAGTRSSQSGAVRTVIGPDDGPFEGCILLEEVSMPAPLRIDALQTPALLIDLAVFERNIAEMSKALPGPRLRPHVKAHKCTNLARRQAAAGHEGFTCATIRECEGMVAAGLGQDLLLANEVLDARRIGALVAGGARVTVAVDSPQTIEAAAAGGVREVVIDVNVGMPRCGCDPADAGRLAGLARLLNGPRRPRPPWNCSSPRTTMSAEN